MTPIWHILLTFAISFGFTIYFSFIGDDDVVYQFMGRNPTPKEGLARVRFVFAKACASCSGGIVMATLLGLYLRKEFLVQFSENGVVCLAMACILVSSLLIGTVQNGIRRQQGRRERPVLDIALWKYTLGRWIGR
jgi:hypothetical protein